jgi:hypothetical protein
LRISAPFLPSGLEKAPRLGTSVAAAIALLPYLSDFFITAYLAGAFAAVWFAIKSSSIQI